MKVVRELGRINTALLKEYIRQRWPKKEKMPFPVSIQIEPTTRCNFSCDTCSRKSLSKTRLDTDMTLENFKEIISKIPSVRLVKLQGFGETMINRELEDILKFGKIRGIKFRIITNGSLLVNENLRKLLLNNFQSIFISIDSIDEKKFAELRKGGNLETIKKGIRQLADDKKKYKSGAKIGMNFVATHLNYREIPELLEFAKELGIKNIGIVEVENWYIQPQKEHKNGKAFVMKTRKVSQKIHDCVYGLVDDAKKYNIEVGFMPSGKRKANCRWPFDSLFITVDGYVTPCCIRMDPDVFNFGNIYNVKDFGDIWHSKKYRAFRDSMLHDKPNMLCDDCPD
jgi:radical SAM protein with 4Fe4S-binding SPASM domain